MTFWMTLDDVLDDGKMTLANVGWRWMTLDDVWMTFDDVLDDVGWRFG